MPKEKSQRLFQNTITYLQKKKKVLLLTTSNRWVGDVEKPKSTLLAEKIKKELDKKHVHVTHIDIPSLTIYPCEGNVSTARGNTCGEIGARLTDKNKNPSGQHRCWASINNANDELWKVSKELFTSDCVLFFTSVRWGQLNSHYQKLIERLTWIENRHSTLGEDNIVKKIDAGLIVVGHNWNGAQALATQKKVLTYFGFNVKKELCWNWQYTTPTDESQKSYKEAAIKFKKTFLE